MSTTTLANSMSGQGDRRQSDPKQLFHVSAEINGISKDPVMTNNNDDKVFNDDEDDHDRGIGTSSAGAAIMEKLGRGLGSRYLDIASLLKEPLIFLPERFPDQANQNVPYEPLPSGPAQHTPHTDMNRKISVKSSGTLLDGVNDPANSSPLTSSASKGKSVSSNDVSSSISVPPTPLPMNWPQSYPVGPGYHNLGNTCFLNSTLQALSHTAPLVACLMGDGHHSSNRCEFPCNDELGFTADADMRFSGQVSLGGKFCLLCAMQRHIRTCFSSKGRVTGAIQPQSIVNRLPGRSDYLETLISLTPVLVTAIARHMRVGRQEDAHEFLRFGLDHMQEAAAKNSKPLAKTDAEKEHTFINRIFGGKLRSRVTCSSCHCDSDTYDRFMDISLDISRVDTVKEALQAFVRVDSLQGPNKYNCEKCKKLANAKKQFTISQAPQILHVHLKRFTTTGKKISGAISYQEGLSLSDYMSEDSEDRNPMYRLYAVICHSGSGPHSGHYFAHVRSGTGRWHCMNDSSVSDIQPSAALSARNAYMLFYERCNRLGDAVGRIKIPINSFSAAMSPPQGIASVPFANGKRKDRDGEFDKHDSNTPQRHKSHESTANAYNSSKHPHQHQRASSFQNHSSSSSSSPYGRNQQHRGDDRANGRGSLSISSNNFFTSQQYKNRPRLVDNMIGKPH